MTGASGWIGLRSRPGAAGSRTPDPRHRPLGEVGCRQAPRRQASKPVDGDLDRPRRPGRERPRRPRRCCIWRTSTTGRTRPSRTVPSGLPSRPSWTALEGTGKPFLFASGVALTPGRHVLTEADPSPFSGPDAPRGGAEALAMEYAARGVATVALRFAPTVHGTGGDHGFIALIARAARERGASAYVGDGHEPLDGSKPARCRTPGRARTRQGSGRHRRARCGRGGRHVEDDRRGASGPPSGCRSSRSPQSRPSSTSAGSGAFFALDIPASAALTRERLGWVPSHPTLVADIAAGAYT